MRIHCHRNKPVMPFSDFSIMNRLFSITAICRRTLWICSIFIGLILVSDAYSGEIHARAAVVMDAETGQVLFAKNPDLRLMPASTTKLMTALVVLDHVDIHDMVTISAHAASIPAVTVGLKKGDTVTVEALLYAALVRSANDAAVALAETAAGSEEAFVDLMNSKARELGLRNTRFINPNGLPGPGQYITAYDLAEIMKKAKEYPLLRDILGTDRAELPLRPGKTASIENTNRLLLSDNGLLIGKTGYTREARHCFVSVKDCGVGTIIVALLGEPSRGLLWEETEYLMSHGERVLNNLEEPVVYIMKADYDAVKVRKAALSKKTSAKKTRKKKRKIAL